MIFFVTLPIVVCWGCSFVCLIFQNSNLRSFGNFLFFLKKGGPGPDMMMTFRRLTNFLLRGWTIFCTLCDCPSHIPWPSNEPFKESVNALKWSETRFEWLHVFGWKNEERTTKLVEKITSINARHFLEHVRCVLLYLKENPKEWHRKGKRPNKEYKDKEP